METLGRYKVLKEIGRGSMGVIYLGFDPEIQRTVAIKTIRWDRIQANIGQDEALERFTNEVKIVGQFQHPHIVTLYDTGEEAGNRYFVMEYVEGRTLDSLIRTEGAPSLDRAVEIIRSIARGLAYAHGKGVIHRDVKPGNVMISNEGQVKITDFGIARCTSFSSNMTRSLTGTPKYISPEQVEGRGVDQRSDLFSLGALSYELLTGNAAFAGETLTEVIQRVVHEALPPLSSLNPAIPPALDRVVLKALEKDPDKRYPDMKAFEEALTSCAEPPAMDSTVPGGLTPAAQKAGRGRRIPRVRPARIAALSMVPLIVLALAASLRFGGWSLSGQGDASRAYAQGIEKARQGEDQAARELFEGLVNEKKKKDKGLVGLAFISLREGKDEEVMHLCGQALASNPENLYARVLRATVFFQQGENEQADAELSQALRGASGADWEKSEAYALLGRIQDARGMPEEALTSYEKAIRLDPSNSVAYTNKGTLLSRLGDYPGALASYQGLLNVSDDPGVRILARESRRRLDLEADKEKGERIRTLIKELDDQRKRTKDPGAPQPEDLWRPRPLTVCVVPFEEEGIQSLDASRGILFQASLYQAFQAESRLSLVDRQVLDKILQELQLAQSELADRDKALHAGKIAGAGVIVTGTLFHLGASVQAVVQIIETETTYVKGALSEEQRRNESLVEFSHRIAGKLSKEIVAAFPLKGRISEIKGEEVVVDFGQSVGAAEGMQFKVLPSPEDDVKRRKAYIGILTLTEVLEESSVARLTATYDTIRPGLRIVELHPEGAGSEEQAREGA